MKNYVQPGNTITLTAPYAVTSGDGLLIGSIFGVAAGTAAVGEAVEAALTGVYDLKKVASQAWAAGDKVYWDNTAREATKTTLIVELATESLADLDEVIRRIRNIDGVMTSETNLLLSTRRATSRRALP